MPTKVTDSSQYKGLCSNCDKRNSCVYVDKEGGVWHCNEYQMQQVDTITEIVYKYDKKPGGIISILQEIQAKYGYLSQESLELVAKNTGRALVDIYAVATFYKSFSLKPRGKHLISVCMGTACHVRSAPLIIAEFERQLGMQAGGTSSGQEFTLETVNCLGACALGPVVVVDGHYFSKVTPGSVKHIIEKVRAGLDKVEVKSDKRVIQVEVSCSRCNHTLMDSEHLIEDQPSIRITASSQRKHGPMWLSSFYGSYAVESEHEIPMNEVVHFFCPHCHAELVGASNCPECAAPMVSMIVKGGGMVQICSRRGCKGHILDLGSTTIY